MRAEFPKHKQWQNRTCRIKFHITQITHSVIAIQERPLAQLSIQKCVMINGRVLAPSLSSPPAISFQTAIQNAAQYLTDEMLLLNTSSETLCKSRRKCGEGREVLYLSYSMTSSLPPKLYSRPYVTYQISSHAACIYKFQSILKCGLETDMLFQPPPSLSCSLFLALSSSTQNHITIKSWGAVSLIVL